MNSKRIIYYRRHSKVGYPFLYAVRSKVIDMKEEKSAYIKI